MNFILIKYFYNCTRRNFLPNGGKFIFYVAYNMDIKFLIYFRSHPLLQPKEISKVIINRSTLSESVIIPFSFSKYQNNWLYIFTAPNAGQQLRGQVVAFSICLVTDVS